MFRKMPFILLSLIIVIGGLSPWIPLEFQSILYAVSLSIKSFIVFVLPCIVFGLLFKTAVHFSNQASKIILLILVAICCSNFLSTMVSYSAGALAYRLDISINFPVEEMALLPAWNLSFPKWVGNDQALFAGLTLGIFLGWLKPAWAKKLSENMQVVVHKLLKVILLTIPFFISGVIVKMNHDRVMTHIFSSYSLIFLLVAVAVFAYIACIYFFANQCSLKATFKSIQNILPAAIAGFGSMSSAAAMPLTILGAEKNSKNADLARSIIPATVNIHLIGDCFAIPIFAFAVLKGFGVEEPSFFAYLMFAVYFVLAKFSVAAIPGGGILVMIPVLESYLGFNAEMLSLITALYILFDPVITGANVLGNGAFAMVVEKLMTPSKSQEAATIN